MKCFEEHRCRFVYDMLIELVLMIAMTGRVLNIEHQTTPKEGNEQ